MVAVLPADDVDRALAVLTARHVPSWVLGQVRRTDDSSAPRVLMEGDHPPF
jgi:phosphoribosylformylglycinamidine cyclo-ligase